MGVAVRAPVRVVTPAFLIVALTLGAAAVSYHVGGAYYEIKQIKKALPLKAPLHYLDEQVLFPYRVLEQHELEPEMVTALGTKRYINWTLEDASVSDNDPLRFAGLFVTYYSGGREMVPHTPDVCYLGAGYNPAQRHENTEVAIAMPGSGVVSLPVRLLTFVKTAVFEYERISVVYTFFCNGQFVPTRTDVRLCVNDPRNTHAFFSKVEVSFPRATREQNLEGARKLFQRVLPVLIHNHWPDFEAAEEAARAARREE